MTEATSVIVSGMHSGPNPSPGLGVARSLKLAGHPARVVGLDYSARSSGLHSPLIDQVVQLPPWHELHIDTWKQQVESLVAETTALFVPCLDLEIRLLSDAIGEHARILAPSARALELVSKPAVAVADALGLAVPTHERNVTPDNVTAFLRHAPHGAWVKGQHYEAFRVRTAAEAADLGRFVSESWGTPWHLESHVPGQECGLAFAARDGELLDAVLMSKTLLTTEGKTWSGEISEPPEGLMGRLADFLLEVRWTGAGEIELVRSWSGQLTVMELNPRFPAWVHGASVCGANLPLALVTGERGSPKRTLSAGFTRVVEEIPVSAALGIDPFIWGSGTGAVPATKHPSGMPELGRRRHRRASAQETPAEDPLAAAAQPSAWDWLATPNDESPPTPYRQINIAAFESRVSALLAITEDLGEVVMAYSVKTCPHPRMLAAAADLGLAAEAISLDELDAAVKHGMSAERAILNGPAKWWPTRSDVRCWAFFADSLAELRTLVRRLDEGFRLSTAVVGVRARSLNLPSRFGLRLDTSEEIAETGALLTALTKRLGARWGMHFHHAESSTGPAQWEREARYALARMDLLRARLGEPPAVVDLGGGWHPDDMDHLAATVGLVWRGWLSGRRDPPPTLVLEPGKLLTQPAAALISRVLVVDTSARPPSVVVDAALGDVPEGPHWAHPIACFTGDVWLPLPQGHGRILGRSCMEADVLADGVALVDVREGDCLAFGMAGAYDLSMAYDFGRGSADSSLVTI